MKYCVTCGKELAQRPTERDAHFDRRQTCGNQCKGPLANRSRYVDFEKTCPVCGQAFTRRADERSTQFRSRKTCSSVCGSRLMARTKRAPNVVKTCAVCGENFERRPTENITKFNAKTACSWACSQVVRAKKRRIVLPDKFCEICGLSFSRNIGEPTGRYAARRTCSRKCNYVARGRARRGVISAQPSPYPREFYELRESIYERDGHCCALCGETHGKRRLAIHHINYAKIDCRPDNLISLCMSCHGKTQHGSQYEWIERFARIVAARESLAA